MQTAVRQMSNTSLGGSRPKPHGSTGAESDPSPSRAEPDDRIVQPRPIGHFNTRLTGLSSSRTMGKFVPEMAYAIMGDQKTAMEQPPLTHESLRMILEDAGLRCTSQRLAVYDQLCQRAHHPTAEEVFQAVRSTIPRISLATVYKALESLVAVGAATKLTAAIGQNSARYDARRDRHYHFRCLRTGAVHDLPTGFDPDLITKLDPELSDYLKRNGFKVMGYHLELLGYQGPENVSEGSPVSSPPKTGKTATPAGQPGTRRGAGKS